MDTSPLVAEEIEAGAELLMLLNQHWRVVAACWVRGAEDKERYLYVALDGLTVDNSDVAYGEVLRITGEMKDRYLDPFRVKLVNRDHPVAKAVLDIYRRYPAKIPTKLNGRTFANMAVADVYIYPPLTSKP